jgi:hypothetical protein
VRSARASVGAPPTDSLAPSDGERAWVRGFPFDVWRSMPCRLRIADGRGTAGVSPAVSRVSRETPALPSMFSVRCSMFDVPQFHSALGVSPFCPESAAPVSFPSTRKSVKKRIGAWGRLVLNVLSKQRLTVIA